MTLRKQHLFSTQHSKIIRKLSRGYPGFKNIRGDRPTISALKTKYGMGGRISVTSLESKMGFKNRKID